MFIPSISAINPGIYAANAYRTSVCNTQPAFKGLSTDTFTKTDENPLEQELAPLFNNMKDFTIDEYKKLSPEEIENINQRIDEVYGKSLKEDVMLNDLAAEGIRQSLDKTYGEGNYVVIPVGRSLSSIGKSLSYKIGEDNVKQLPISRASRFINVENSNEDFDKFNEYLNSVGLSKETIESSGKKYIFTDYSATGASLWGLRRLLESDKVWGEQPNVSIIKVQNILSDDDKNINDDVNMDNSQFKAKLVYNLLEYSYKQYSLVDRCENLADTQKAVINPEDYSIKTKSFMFKLLDREMQKGNAEAVEEYAQNTLDLS